MLIEAGLDEESFWAKVEDLALKSMVAIEPELRIWERARQDIDVKGGAQSFQILGFDVLIDKNHKFWLLEINHNPSLSIDGETEVAPGVLEHSVSQVDVDVKTYAVTGALKYAIAKLSKGPDSSHVRGRQYRHMQGRKCVFEGLVCGYFDQELAQIPPCGEESCGVVKECGCNSGKGGIMCDVGVKYTVTFVLSYFTYEFLTVS